MDTYQLMAYGYLHLMEVDAKAQKAYEKQFLLWKKDGMREDTSIYEKLILLEEQEKHTKEQKEKAFSYIKEWQNNNK